MSGMNADINRKKRKMDAVTDTEVVCSTGCKKCEDFMDYILRRNRSRKDYEKDKELTALDNNTLYMPCDLQKVILLPRLPGYKRSIFTSHLIAFNMTFAPIGLRGKGHASKAVGVLWHKAISGRKDENITSAYIKMFSHVSCRDNCNWVIWADNCRGQNKCWTLYTMLVGVVNSHNLMIKKITMKYFTVGHSFMSANNLHRSVEKEIKNMDKVYDFSDFVQCVSNAGAVVLMTHSDFTNLKLGLVKAKHQNLQGRYYVMFP